MSSALSRSPVKVAFCDDFGQASWKCWLYVADWFASYINKTPAMVKWRAGEDSLDNLHSEFESGNPDLDGIRRVDFLFLFSPFR